MIEKERETRTQSDARCAGNWLPEQAGLPKSAGDYERQRSSHIRRRVSKFFPLSLSLSLVSLPPSSSPSSPSSTSPLQRDSPRSATTPNSTTPPAAQQHRAAALPRHHSPSTRPLRTRPRHVGSSLSRDRFPHTSPSSRLRPAHQRVFALPCHAPLRHRHTTRLMHTRTTLSLDDHYHSPRLTRLPSPLPSSPHQLH